MAFMVLSIAMLNTHAEVLQNRSLKDSISFTVGFKTYDPDYFNKVIREEQVEAISGNAISYQGSQWRLEIITGENLAEKGIRDMIFELVCTQGSIANASVAVNINFDDWSKDNFVMVPAALYNGNRYPWRRIRYSPKLMDPRDIGPDKGIILSDVPRLNRGRGPSRVQLRSGAMTTPSFSFWDPAKKQGFILLTEQATRFGDNGIFIEENKRRDKAVVSVVAPVVREFHKYFITDSQFPSDDPPATFSQGDTIRFRLKMFVFDSPRLQGLYDRFARVCKDLTGKADYNNVLPLSEAFRVQQQKFNSDNWVEEHGYYSVGMRNMFLQDWQIGWTGGMISTYPLLFAGNEVSEKNVIRNFDWLFPDGLSPSGFFWDSGEHGTKWYGGDIRKPHTKNWHLVRKSGDGLFFILQQLGLMKLKGITIKQSWDEGTKGVADAFVKLWEENAQLGQFVDSNSGEIQVGGSTSGGIVPAALVLAYRRYGDRKYLETAIQIADHYYTNYTVKGLTCGGPGDAMQNFDSESSYALIEGYFCVYEETGDKKWLQAAEEAAKQFSTWVMSYNYKFPEASTQGKLGIKAIGAVFANTQNTHGSPGICTHSGIALLRLYRATMDQFYLELLNDITHAIPQCLSHPANKIEGMQDGWMGERINTTDWLEGIGELMYGSTWSETSLMLTYTQIPGLYVIPDKSEFICFDNLEARLLKETRNKLVLEVKNPTQVDARIRILSENSNRLHQPLGYNYLFKGREEFIAAGKTRQLTFER